MFAKTRLHWTGRRSAACVRLHGVLEQTGVLVECSRCKRVDENVACNMQNGTIKETYIARSFFVRKELHIPRNQQPAPFSEKKNGRQSISAEFTAESCRDQYCISRNRTFFLWARCQLIGLMSVLLTISFLFGFTVTFREAEQYVNLAGDCDNSTYMYWIPVLHVHHTSIVQCMMNSI